MPEARLQIGDKTPDLPTGSWVLILGGVSRIGNRRARRFATNVAQKGGKVLWLDGFEETWEDSNEPVSLSPEASPDSVVVVGYRDQERRFILNRLADFLPRFVFAPGSWIAASLGHSERESVAHLGRRVRRVTRKLGAALRSKFLGKLAAAFRGRAGYKIVRPQLTEIARSTSPFAIIYCDDFALTIAWHAARIWADVPVSSELPN